MSIRALRHSLVVVGLVIAGCSGAGMGAMSPAPYLAAQRGASSDLLYVSDEKAGAVYVYSYPQLRLKETLTGFGEPQGLCSDAKGDVFVVDNKATRIVEYAHGGRQPIAKLAALGSPIGCAVDPMTGNMAVADAATSRGNSSNPRGAIVIYAKAKGAPERYVNPASLATVYFCAYDGNGNLLADGFKPDGSFGLAEMSAQHAKHFIAVSWNGPAIPFPGGVLWDGSYWVIGDQGIGTGSAVYDVRIDGSRSTIVARKALAETSDVIQFSIAGAGNRKRLIAPDSGDADVTLYTYPSIGKRPVATLTGGFAAPFGATISTTGS